MNLQELNSHEVCFRPFSFEKPILVEVSVIAYDMIVRVIAALENQITDEKIGNFCLLL